MADPLVATNSVQELAKLSEGLAAYKEASGKTSAAILVQKGGQLIYGNQNPKFGATFDGLSQLFFGQAPADGAIWAAARARHFRVGRRQYGGDLSPKSYARAREMMGGFKSIMISVNPETGAVGFVRAGIRKRKGKGFRVYFRYGRQSSAVSGKGNTEYVGGIQKGANDKVVNLRAVATFFELQKRDQGRRFLAASWLYRRWRKLAQSDPRRDGQTWRLLKNINPRSEVQPLGQAGLEGNEKAGDIALRITSFVPGTMSIGESRGLFARAIAGVRADLDTYIARKHAEALAAALQGKAT